MANSSTSSAYTVQRPLDAEQHAPSPLDQDRDYRTQQAANAEETRAQNQAFAEKRPRVDGRNFLRSATGYDELCAEIARLTPLGNSPALRMVSAARGKILEARAGLPPSPTKIRQRLSAETTAIQEDGRLITVPRSDPRVPADEKQVTAADPKPRPQVDHLSEGTGHAGTNGLMIFTAEEYAEHLLTTKDKPSKTEIAALTAKIKGERS